MDDIRTTLAERSVRVGEVSFLSIDGHGGSGKSTLASYLAERLNAEIVHIDDFLGWDSPPGWWTAIIEKVFKPISEGAATITYQPVRWSEDHSPSLVRDQPVTPLMILEGVTSSRPEFRNHIAFNIFVDTPKEICLQRGIERDRVSGKSDEALLEIWRGWLAEEEQYFAELGPKEHADLVVYGTQPFKAQIKV